MSDADRKWLVVASLVFAVVLLLVAALLAASGERVPLYGIIACVTILPALYQSRVRRIWSVGATLLVLVLLIWDHHAGRRLQRSSVGTNATVRTVRHVLTFDP